MDAIIVHYKSMGAIDPWGMASLVLFEGFFYIPVNSYGQLGTQGNGWQDWWRGPLDSATN